MGIKVSVARDFDQMSAIAAASVEDAVRKAQAATGGAVLGLATGNSPTGMYKILARRANEGAFDPARIRSFNLDEYVGLPGENAQLRTMHPESYAFFMIQELFSRLDRKFAETRVPYGALVEQGRLEAALEESPADWTYAGADAGKAIVIKDDASNEYLRWIKAEIQEAYEQAIKAAGGIDVQVIGVGGRGHVAFHESGIPFERSRVLLVKLDDDTIRNAVADGHFATEAESPRYAVSMGAELVYEARKVVLVANGERKREPIARSLLDDPSPEIPISYGQAYAARGGELHVVVDQIAGRDLLEGRSVLERKGVVLEDLRGA